MVSRIDCLKRNRTHISSIILGGVIGIVCTDIIYKFKISNIYMYWLWLPLVFTLIAFGIIKIALRIKLNSKNAFIIYFISEVVMLLVLLLEIKIIENLQWHNWAIGILVLVLVIINISVNYIFEKSSNTEAKEKSLFNLFYINASKAHEIAMLIDNHIMKTVEKQQVSGEITKHSYSIKTGSSQLADVSSNYYMENSNKKSVFESFDVKTTKSIMLRKIYDKVKEAKTDETTGKVLMYKDIKLVPLNIDDTIMVLNILRDSASGKVKTDENIELNLSKMIEKVLEDFTIDYEFEVCKKKYIIRIPYNNKEHFENNYSFSDLQLGRLDVIGINRGEVDFSSVTDVSAKFLKSFSESYNSESNKIKNDELKSSSSIGKSNGEMQFNIKPTELTEKYILIDIVAIIQKIHFEKLDEK